MTEPAQAIPGFQAAPLFFLIAVFLMLQPLSTDLYLASLPSLATVFAVPASTVQLTLSLFVAGFGGAQLVIGPLSDRYGRRPVVIAGLSLYLLASLLCGASQSIGMLIFARFLQALGCCSAVIIARAIVRDAYAPQDSVRVISKASSWVSAAPLLGPILGSFLQVHLGWRAAFVVHALLATALLIMVIARLPETNLYKDPKATELSGLARNYRIVLGSPLFWAYALPGALSYGSIFVFISGASFVLIKVLALPTGWFGYCFAFGVSGYLSGTVVCRRLHARFGTKLTLRIGSSLSLAAGAIFLAMVLAGMQHWAMIPPVMFMTMGAHGINFPISQSNSVSPFPQQAGTAAGLMGALYMLVAFIVGTIVGGTHNGTVYPLAIIACSMGSLIFIAARVLPAMIPAEHTV
ncbi:multidrug effflux MFS transporter [Undibacterium sp. CY18W]|uniref:Bcr/CflA family efflux transporter n=1 Tax=Undibacterium hunanense TaxID=2762292 RepID=A0ABR6ZYX6_9BURK|nr:multidrug effflux MFS transporter [Undibacterium hunanense]MBC3921026.1 multidrug effflux MFS transporter [Undibacterium hunanense]